MPIPRPPTAATPAAAVGERRRAAPGFLELPLEIRLQIYGWVHLQHPMRPAELMGYPSPNYSAYFVETIVPGVLATRVEDEPTKMHRTTEDVATTPPPPHPPRQQHRLLSPHRPLCYVPTAVLQTCRQVYAEARATPFHGNEFIFSTWFSSGLAAASAFVHKTLRSGWQRQALRFARLELHVKDLCTAGPRLRDWEALCETLSPGLRGLRLKIDLDDRTLLSAVSVGRPPARVWARPSMHDDSVSDDGDDSGGGRGTVFSPAWSREPFRWVDAGLAALAALRFLEVELAGMPGLSNDDKSAWCESLAERLNRGRDPRATVSVVCVERARRPPGSGGKGCGVFR
ncbi:hypothetical protein B0T24DRAFT_519066 [Lasiosphaeria ovina]|uniref:Uncharacterized protein n=1 Tax=Lasiosphaeria ovina TaxID=92902 RepID=A0AAE0NK74_9PEZI|nr:hypothetical protein B0T24DRAFT_519066 [Lasiosphaeria ovina]